MANEQKTRAVAAEMGIPPGSAAVSLKAAMEALMAKMPDSNPSAMTQAELFYACGIPSPTTGQKALRALLSEDKIQRIGEGICTEPYRYFARKRKCAPTAFGVSTKRLAG
jgi:hypothetical protein